MHILLFNISLISSVTWGGQWSEWMNKWKNGGIKFRFLPQGVYNRDRIRHRHKYINISPYSFYDLPTDIFEGLIPKVIKWDIHMKPCKKECKTPCLKNNLKFVKKF